MTEISKVGGNTALAFLKSAQADRGPGVLSNFTASSVFGGTSTRTIAAINIAFGANSKLQGDYDKFYKQWMNLGDASAPTSPDNAKFSGLAETIMANRSSFPPEEFTIHADFEDGGSATTTIPAASAFIADSFKAAQEQRVQDFAQSQVETQGSSISQVDSKLATLGKIVETLSLNSQPYEDDAIVRLFAQYNDSDLRDDQFGR